MNLKLNVVLVILVLERYVLTIKRHIMWTIFPRNALLIPLHPTSVPPPSVAIAAAAVVVARFRMPKPLLSAKLCMGVGERQSRRPRRLWRAKSWRGVGPAKQAARELDAGWHGGPMHGLRTA